MGRSSYYNTKKEGSQPLVKINLKYSCIFVCIDVDLKNHIQLDTHSNHLIYNCPLPVTFQNSSTHLTESGITDCALNTS